MFKIINNIACKNTWFLCFFLGLSIFAQTEVIEIGNLEERIGETSGLIYFDDKLITHNDSGNTAELFEIDPTSGAILRIVQIINAQNRDWEDLAQDEDYIYIGDFGNFNGNRTDLRIYKISKAQYLASDTVTAALIEFNYEDQSDFTAAPNSDWDAEALFAYEDVLVVLTKQWKSAGTVAYKLPKTSGVHMAKRLDSYQVEGLITGATYDELKQQLILIGYSRLLLPFFVEVSGLNDTSIFSGTVSKSPLNTGIAQVESIAHSENRYFFTCENYTNTSFQITSLSRLFFFELEPKIIPQNIDKDIELLLYQPMGPFTLNYQLATDDTVFERAIFDMTGRLIFYDSDSAIKNGKIDTSSLRPSIYFITFYLKKGRISKPFVIR
ncbi:T9SS type A sorting domain-containing protein [Flagellimonas sp. 389]|uniref:T9SS type A sorting domain-containing protein n=1 Tax=Flagellimonas sp. 389 TaxID=2835862 RepID=UPI001BD3CAEC|nr:T9SS type A sorting domain-containing protein [Flagellimonas sp. 389]MBS9462132.1 T9SS type A sorting domain-containing protein [Flagellimonas sp. 389]